MSKITEEDAFKMRELFKSGVSSTSIGREFGVTHTTVLKWMSLELRKEHNKSVVFGRKPYKVSREDIAAMIKMLEAGASYAEIGRIYRINH